MTAPKTPGGCAVTPKPGTDRRPARDFRPKLWALRRSWRWLFNAHCEFETCSGGRRCWRWHIEMITCPYCHVSVREDDEPNAGNVARTLARWMGTGTYGTGTSVTVRWPQ